MSTKAPLYIEITNRVYQITIEDTGFRNYIRKEFHLKKSFAQKPVFFIYFLNKENKNKELRNSLHVFVIRKQIPSNAYPFFEFFLKIIIEFSLLRDNILFLHASSVSYKERGIIFSGPIGAGKTTTLLKCKKYFSSPIYSEDTAILQCKNKVVYLLPSPFDKKSDILLPPIPLQQMYFLHQSGKDKVHRLSPSLSIKRLLENDLLYQYYYPKKVYYKKKGLNSLNKINIPTTQYKLLIKNVDTIANKTFCNNLYLSLKNSRYFLLNLIKSGADFAFDF